MELIFASILLMVAYSAVLLFIFIITNADMSGAWAFLLGGIMGLNFMVGYTAGKDDADSPNNLLVMTVENHGQDTLLKSNTQWLEVYDGELYDIENDQRMGPVKVLRNQLVVGTDTILFTKERN